MEDLKRLLAQQKGVNGVSLMTHLCSLVTAIQQEQGKGSVLGTYENLERLSDLVKKNQFVYKEPRGAGEVNSLVQKREEHTSDLTVKVEQLESLLQDLLKTESTPGQVQNWMLTSRLFHWAGVGFGEMNDYHIQAALKKVARENNTSEVSFWGKILGENQDYWVIMGRLRKYYQDQESTHYSDPNGTGCNSCVFWVSNDLTGQWFELPQVEERQVKASRVIKRVLKGDLDCPVDGYPRFPGQEKHLLKCQLVRLTHSSWIVPAGLYKGVEEQEGVPFCRGEVEFAEDFKVPEVAELNNPEAWSHKWPMVLKTGGVQHRPDMSLNEETRQTVLDEAMLLDPEQDPLRGINEDTPLDEATPAWNIKLVGDHQVFAKEDSNVNYAPLLFNNLRWPGTKTIVANGTFASIYVGYGYKGDSQPLFFPQEPNDVIDDPEEQDEKSEPNPKNPLNEVEPDSDDEKKEGEEDDA